MFLAEREQKKHAHTGEGLWHADLNRGNEELAWSNSHESSENILCGIIYCKGSFLHLLGIILRHKEAMSTFLSLSTSSETSGEIRYQDFYRYIKWKLNFLSKISWKLLNFKNWIFALGLLEEFCVYYCEVTLFI